MWRRAGLCLASGVVLTVLAYLNQRAGVFPGLYAWVWLSWAWVGLVFGGPSACFRARLAPKSQFLLLLAAWAWTAATLWGRAVDAQWWQRALYGAFLAFLYGDGLAYGLRLVKGAQRA